VAITLSNDQQSRATCIAFIRPYRPTTWPE
jgi:hypothetical protein